MIGKQIGLPPRRRPGILVVAIAAVVLGAVVVVGAALAQPLLGGPGGAGSSGGIAGGPTPGLSPGPSGPPGSPGLASTPPSPGPSGGPSPSPSPTSYPPLADGVVPMLYLHRVSALPAAWSTWTPAHQHTFLSYDVLPSAFAADLDWLKAHGYTTILPRDLAAHWDHGTPLPPRPVIISLDDGFASWTNTVLPMLQARGMVAEFYLTLDAITHYVIGWNQVRQLAAAGMGIGAHDVHHIQLAQRGPGRPDFSAAEMWFEVSQARIIIGREIGVLPDSMAYVGGGFSPELEALVQKAGYTTARSILRGIVQQKAHRFTLRVIALGPCDDVLNPVTEALRPGLPIFAAQMAGDVNISSGCPVPKVPSNIF